MTYLGDFPAGQTVHFKWNSCEAGGASVTRATNGTIYVYKDDATGTEVTTGVTDTEDHDSLTGVHHCAIVTSDGFYAAGCDYFVVLKAATIDGEVVNACLAHFSIENRYTGADVLKWNGTAVATPDTAGYPKVTVKDGTGTGEIDLNATGKVLLQDDAVTAAVVATGAIDADALAADAVTEILAAIMGADPETYGAGTVGEAVAFLRAFVSNKKAFVYTGANSGQIWVYNVAGDAVLYKLQVQDIDAVSVGAVPTV